MAFNRKYTQNKSKFEKNQSYYKNGDKKSEKPQQKIRPELKYYFQCLSNTGKYEVSVCHKYAIL